MDRVCPSLLPGCLQLRSFGYMLRFVVSAAATNINLVRCNSDVPISSAPLTCISDSPDLGIIGTTSLQDLDSRRSSRQRLTGHPVRQGSAWHPAGRSCYRSKFDEVWQRCGVRERSSRFYDRAAARAGRPMFSAMLIAHGSS